MNGVIYIQKNLEDLEDVFRYSRDNNLETYIETFVTLGASKEKIEEMTISQEELIDFFTRLQKIDKKEYNINTPILPGSRVYGRRTCKNQPKFAIKDGGKIYGCISRIAEEDILGVLNDQENIDQTLTKVLKKIIAKQLTACCICSETIPDDPTVNTCQI